MQITVREIEPNDIEKVVDYFVNADSGFLKEMGADKSKLPKREEWIKKLKSELEKKPSEKEFYYVIWLLDDQAIGHSNINKIEFGNIATMHLHLWKNDQRRNGLGFDFLRLTIPYYFKNLRLEKLICEPKSENIAPNRVLQKLGFELVRTYETTPGWINFHQTVNRYELKRGQIGNLKNGCL